MTIEEKAQAYDDALKLARDYHEDKNCFKYLKGVLENIFPELAESEDEGIRKLTIHHLDRAYQNCKFDEYKKEIEKCIAWLERQGEQKQTMAIPKWKYKKDSTPLLQDSIILNKYGCVAKSPSGAIVSDVWILDYNELAKLPKEKLEQESIDKVEPKFKVGDWIISNDKQSTYQVVDVKRGMYVIRDVIDNHEYNIGIDECEKHGRKWTIEDAKDGDVLLFEGYYNSIVLFQGVNINGKGRINYHCKCDLGDYSFGIQGDVAYLGTIEKDAEHYHPATKEQRDFLFQKMRESGFEWDAEKKVLKKIEKQGKPKWSDDDEQYLLICKNALRKYQVSDKWDAEIISKWLEDKLKQGEQKPKWSEEDECYMSECIGAIATKDGWSFEEKRKTKHWLKSLKQRQVESKWIEEDSKMLGTLIAIFEVNYPNEFYKVNPIGTTDMQGIHSSEIVKWIRTIKQRMEE